MSDGISDGICDGVSDGVIERLFEGRLSETWRFIFTSEAALVSNLNKAEWYVESLPQVWAARHCNGPPFLLIIPDILGAQTNREAWVTPLMWSGDTLGAWLASIQLILLSDLVHRSCTKTPPRPIIMR
jgi:hypothetical protein